MTKGYSRVDLEYVSDHHPIDGLAARVTQTGEHYELDVSPCLMHSNVPEVTKKAGRNSLLNSNFEDLTGKVIGRLTVIGMSTKKTNNKVCWSVRCVCGNYEHRKSKFIKGFLNGEYRDREEPMCAWCNNTRKLRDNLRK